MCLSKSRCWYSNKCLHFLNCVVPLKPNRNVVWNCSRCGDCNKGFMRHERYMTHLRWHSGKLFVHKSEMWGEKSLLQSRGIWPGLFWVAERVCFFAFTMDKLKLKGLNLGRVFNYSCSAQTSFRFSPVSFRAPRLHSFVGLPALTFLYLWQRSFSDFRWNGGLMKCRSAKCSGQMSPKSDVRYTLSVIIFKDYKSWPNCMGSIYNFFSSMCHLIFFQFKIVI